MEKHTAYAAFCAECNKNDTLIPWSVRAPIWKRYQEYKKIKEKNIKER